MTSRNFPEERIEQDIHHEAGQFIPAMKISCAVCSAVDYFAFLKKGVRKPPIAAAQHFQNKGWLVGSSPRKDRCPIHAHVRETKPVPVSDFAEPIPAAGNVTPLHADPPRQMTREDRRIINDKLDDVYGNERYKAAWTDASVAKDLGVPRAWVSEVRETFFGPEGSNPAFDEYLERAAKHASLVERFNDICRQIEPLANEAVGLKRMIIEDAAEILRIGRRIEKELGR